jgi:hypothetical protein
MMPPHGSNEFSLLLIKVIEPLQIFLKTMFNLSGRLFFQTYINYKDSA